MPQKSPRRLKHSSAPAKPASQRQSFPIVGVGASAGGLEAFTAFLKNLPPDSGMGFVLIQHLDPKQHSELTELLAKASPMPVLEVTADTTVKANRVYVISPGVSLSIGDGRLRAEPRESGRNLPIDRFLRSLAGDKRSNAIGIVLSGTASDGTLGLKAIKAEGGITFAQEPSSAKFDGMPRSAIAAGVVDFILPPDEIAKRVVRLAKHPYVARKPEEADDRAEEMELDLNRIFHLLRTATGTDFTHYKPPTVRRRIHRRMVLHGSEKLRDYVSYLQEDPAEVRALADDLLICVTSFFRAPEAFEALATKVFPQIFETRSAQEPIRIWVPGCATGEEAYSIAICLAEFLERSGANAPIQIFATDVSEAALDKARAGKYGMPALADVSPARLKRFFTKTDGGYQIHKSIREACIFAKQNVVKDPPFRSLDLISCCNVLIYFEHVLQRKALSIFHYALKTDGFLMLGPAEGVGALPNAFSHLDKKIKLYLKQPGLHPLNLPFSANEPLAAKAPGGEAQGENARVPLDVQKAAERMLLAQYAPAGVIVDDALNVVHVRGDTGPYLQLASGEPTYNLLRMAREGLVVGLRAAFLKARQKRAVISQPVRVRQNGGFKEVNLKIIPVGGPVRAGVPHFMVLFEDTAPYGGVAPYRGVPPTAPPGAIRTEEQEGGSAKPAKTIAKPQKTLAKPQQTSESRTARENSRLKQELAATREYLQAIIEEQEASTEELKSTSEEAQASNEELETSKEELQSANEELNTVNEELRTRNVALIEVYNDLSNVLTGINVPLVMVGEDLKIRRFTQAIEPMLNLINSDIGRSISDLKPNIDILDLAGMLRSVVQGAKPGAREIQSPEGRWYSLQALPYRAENRIAGALLALFDIDAVKHGRDYAEAVMHTTRQPLVILNGTLKVRSANDAFYETFQISREDAENRLLYDLGNGQWNIPELRAALERILPDRREFRDLEVDREFEGIGRKILLLSGREIQQPAPYGHTILLAIEDITERKEQQRIDLLKNEQALASERKLRELEAELARVVRALTVGELAVSIAHEVNQPLAGVVTNAEAGLRWLRGKTPNLHEAQESLALIVRDGNRAGEVIRRIREFLKKDDHEMTAFDINEAVQEALAFADAELERSKVALRVELSRELPLVRGNRIQLQQVVLNLIMNSRDATAPAGEGSREVVLTSQRSPGPGGSPGVLVTVRDSGIGVKPQDLDRMFDAFFTTKPRGMGMGLSISRSIIEAHGGRIWATPNDGPGLTVQFSLPAEGS
ncbi:Methylase of chemotaxis methyl-accepting protein [Candidatus Sulfopaludibacter sp. SbA4]|nr:Methylase of chemotaxis methyl-accepting protein [Candidatus Sulfopaludibacter sp. SbA4]